MSLPEFDQGVWLMTDYALPDAVVRADEVGTVVETLWEQDPEVVGSFSSGHTLVCDDINDDNEMDLVDLHFSFDGPLHNVYRETRSLDGQIISETDRPVDGTSVPDEIHQICGEHAGGPILRVTQLQWSATLRQAGFTNVGGDYAIDPVWAALGTWNGTEYWPLDLYQGDFRPEPNDEAMLIECDLGGIVISNDLPDDARSALLAASGC